MRFRSILTVSLNYMGTISRVINDAGSVTPPGTVPVNVISYP